MESVKSHRNISSHVSLPLPTLSHAIRPVNQPGTSLPSPAIRKQPAGYHFFVTELLSAIPISPLYAI